MMEMQPEAESCTGQVSCGGQLRTVWIRVFSTSCAVASNPRWRRLESARLPRHWLQMRCLWRVSHRRMLSLEAISTPAERPCAAAS